MVSIGMVGYGSCLPERRVSTEEVVAEINRAPENQSPERQTSVEWLMERTGIERRARSNLRTESAPILATIAAERALKDAGISFSDLEFIIGATNSTDVLLVPGIAPRVQHLLSDKESEIPAHDVHAGCSGAVYAIEGALMKLRYLCAEEKRKKIPYGLVVAVDTLSNIINHADRGSAPLLADGAGAVVIGQVERGGIKHIFTKADGSAGYHIAYTGYGTIPSSQFRMNGKRVHQFVLERAVPSIEELMEKSGFSLEDLIRLVLIPHQMNLRSIDAFLERLVKHNRNPFQRRPKYVYTNGIVNYGNTSAASVLIGVDETYREGHIEQGDLVMPVAFGGGLTWGGFLEVAHRTPPTERRIYNLEEQRSRVAQLNERYDKWKRNLPGITID